MAKDMSTDDIQPPRCPGKSGQRCASFVRADSPHELCRKCRACDVKHPCKLCEHKSPAYWRALDARGKRSSKSKSQTPASDVSPESTTKSKSRKSAPKSVGEDNAGSVSIRKVNVPQQGPSSVLTLAKILLPVRVLCADSPQIPGNWGMAAASRGTPPILPFHQGP